MRIDPDIRARIDDVTVAHMGDSKLVFIAAQVAEDTALDIGGQTREVLHFVERLLAHVGARREHLVSARIHLVSPAEYREMMQVWEAWLAPDCASLRATVGAKEIPNHFKVEIEVTAAFTPAKSR